MMLMAMMMGGVVVSVSGAIVSDSDGGVSGSASATLRFDADGNVYAETENGGSAQLSPSTDWVRPAAFAPNYYIRATLQSGDPPAGPDLSTWHAMTEDREWTHTRSVAGTSAGQLLIEISTDQTTVVASATYTIAATVL